jgi:putative ABC transport system ATP-binding protein
VTQQLAVDDPAGPGSRAALVRCDSVARTYGTGPAAVVAVHSVTCQVAAGDRIALVGPSGSGKSTLLHLLAGLDTPTVGQVSWPGLAAGSRRIAVVFQGPSLIPALDVVENVALPLVLAGLDPRAADVEARAALAALGSAPLAGRLPEELSGGQAQRVAVARVLAQRPALILADEPTGQLDRLSADRLVTVLLDVAGRLGAALVVATHDPAVAGRLDLRWSMSGGALSDAPAVAAQDAPMDAG